jgi:hypothetical protein
LCTSKRQQVSRRTVWTVKWDEIYFEVELEVELLVVINLKKKQATKFKKDQATNFKKSS